MSDAELLDELLVRWEDEYALNHDITPEELCRAAPHLADRAAQEIAKLKQFRSTPAFETTPVPPPTSPLRPPPPVLAFAGLRYEPQRHHASGGLGDVFVARDQELDREVALKRIQPRYADEPDAQGRFEREAEITGRLEHPGVVPLYGRGRDADGRPYYAMRFIRGKSLREAIEEFYKAERGKRDAGERGLAFRGLLQRFTAACNTVAYAHSRGVIHRDLKPANIMLGPYGETLVVDWGLAKYVGRDEPHRNPAEESLRPAPTPDGYATQAGAAMGTLAYMSPEQARGQTSAVGPASDVFSLGATLYEILTSQTAYRGAQALVDAAAGKFPQPRQVRRDVPPALEAVCLTAMAFQPKERYATALEMARDVDRWLADEPTAAYREPWRVRARRWVVRHRTPVAATAGALLVGALLVGGGLWWKAEERDRQERAAARQADEMERDVLAALAETSRLEGQGQWEAARAAAARAAGRLAGGGSEHLGRRVRQAQADLNLEARLEELAVEMVALRPDVGLREPAQADRPDKLFKGSQMGGVTAVRNPAQIDRDYAAVLRDGGAPLDAAEPEEIAAWVRASAISEQLIQALDNWAYLKREAKIDGAERLREAAQRADDGNDWRHRLRDLSDQGKREALEQLAAHADVLEQPPAALAYLGRSLFQVGATAVAVETLRKAQQRYPGDLGINFLLASVLNPPFFSELAEERILSDRAEAVGFCRAALALRPGNPRLHDTLGFLLLECVGKLEQAEAEFRRAIELDPKDAVAHTNLGSVLLCNNKLEEAAAELRRAIELDPKYSDAHMTLGNVLYNLHKSDEAAAEFHLVIDFARAEQGKRGAAAKYHSGVEYDPFFEEINGHLGLANVLAQQGKLDDAVAEYGRCIELAPKDPGGYFNRAFTLWDQGKLDDAAADCRRVIELSPKFMRAHRKLADVLKRQGKPEAAATEYRTAARLFAEELVRRLPEAPDRGDLLLSEERYDGARSAAQASAGPGDAASGLDDKERARLRGQALDWLRADWRALEKWRQEDSKAGPYIQERFGVWKYGEELAVVRDADALAKLPEAEREAWRKLWADVDALMAKVNGAKAP